MVCARMGIPLKKEPWRLPLYKERNPMFTKTIRHYWLPVALMMVLPICAFAADGAEAPALVPAIMALWAAIQAHSTTAVTLVPVFQILRSNELAPVLSKLSGRYLQAVIAIVTTGGFIASAWAAGSSLGEALVTGLFTSGGAMLIYDAFRSIKNPSEPAAPAA